MQCVSQIQFGMVFHVNITENMLSECISWYLHDVKHIYMEALL